MSFITRTLGDEELRLVANWLNLTADARFDPAHRGARGLQLPPKRIQGGR
jgi:hypothetical protein